MAVTIVIFFLICIYYIHYLRLLKEDQKLIDDQLTRFMHAIYKNNIEEMSYFGNKLVLNRGLTEDQLSKVTKTIYSKAKDYPELGKLRIDLFHRQRKFSESKRAIGP